jgi:asparagine synthase (glutamine-hydrolysing)
MCGIAGILNRNDQSVNPELLQGMVRMLNHRGPDACGIHREKNVGLAHTRLSIIDIGGGQQPMSNAAKNLWITFNGEIFNYVELRDELQRNGHTFATQSDTEVILHLYEEMGEECVHRFNGQWAFAIWDSRRQRLFLSRDRMGVRPLFYTLTREAFIFGSEIKSILTHPGVPRSIDPIALDQIFTFWTSIPPRTIFQDIRELPPGHSITVEGAEASVHRYWQMDYSELPPPPHDIEGSEEEIAEQLLGLLVDATKIRLRSDVPVGAYLSGGLDSTVITGLIRRFTDTPLKTFSVTFDDPEFDESRYQNEVVHFLETDHEKIRCSYRDIGRVFPDVIWHTEKPILRTAPAPLYLLSRLVHDHNFKVVLTGEGSDEILGGYDIFKEAKIRRFFGRYPDSQRRPLLLKRLYPYLQGLQTQSPAYLRAFFHAEEKDLLHPFFSHLPRWELTSKIKIFFSENIKRTLQSYDGYTEMEGLLPKDYSRWDPFSQGQYLESTVLLPGYILSSQGDRMAMAHSVEGRFPFLDNRVVSFASRLSPRLKMKVLNEKYLLKRCAGPLIPDAVKNRPKQPYRAPDAKSFFPPAGHGMPEDYVLEHLSPEQIEKDGIFHPQAVQKLVEKAKTGRMNGVRDNMALVGILSTQIILDQYINHFQKRIPNA